MKLVFSSTDEVDARRHRDELIKRIGKMAAKAGLCLENGFDDAMAVMEHLRSIVGGPDARLSRSGRRAKSADEGENESRVTA